MKIFLLVFLTFVVFTAASHASAAEEHKLQHALLAEIIQSLNEMNANLTTEIFVQNVITAEHCTYMNFCKAGDILSEFKAEQFGLKEKDWLLPRRLVAYSRHVDCNVPASEERIKLHRLLDNIKRCAQKEYLKSFTGPTQSPFS